MRLEGWRQGRHAADPSQTRPSPLLEDEAAEWSYGTTAVASISSRASGSNSRPT